MKVKTETMSLQPGESILLFTDGFVETQNVQGEVLGYDRLMQFVKDNHHLPPDALLDGLLACRARFAENTPLEDDLTFLVLKRGE